MYNMQFVYHFLSVLRILHLFCIIGDSIFSNAIHSSGGMGNSVLKTVWLPIPGHQPRSSLYTTRRCYLIPLERSTRGTWGRGRDEVVEETVYDTRSRNQYSSMHPVHWRACRRRRFFAREQMSLSQSLLQHPLLVPDAGALRKSASTRHDTIHADGK